MIPAIVLSTVVVVLIAWVALGRVSAELMGRPATSVYDLNEAVEYIADELPTEMQAKLSPDDVDQIIRWRLNYLREHGQATLGRVDEQAEFAARNLRKRGRDATEGEDDLVDWILAEAEYEELDVNALDVVVVLDLEANYLRAIGAVGPKATT